MEVQGVQGVIVGGQRAQCESFNFILMFCIVIKYINVSSFVNIFHSPGVRSNANTAFECGNPFTSSLE